MRCISAGFVNLEYLQTYPAESIRRWWASSQRHRLRSELIIGGDFTLFYLAFVAYSVKVASSPIIDL